MQAIEIARTGLQASQHWIDRISHNVANMQTPGFKRISVQFADMVGRPQRTSGAGLEAAGGVNGLGTRILDSVVEFEPGGLQGTGNALDVAIDGGGFLEVERPSGEPALTRTGRLAVSPEGRLTLQSGLVLSSNIRVAPDMTHISIEPDGKVKGRVGEAGAEVELGELSLVNVPNPDGLRPLGDGLYTVTEASGDAITGRPGVDGMGELRQRFVETANVQLEVEMTNLMLAQRVYQLCARVIQVGDQFAETLNNLRR